MAEYKREEESLKTNPSKKSNQTVKNQFPKTSNVPKIVRQTETKEINEMTYESVYQNNTIVLKETQNDLFQFTETTNRLHMKLWQIKINGRISALCVFMTKRIYSQYNCLLIIRIFDNSKPMVAKFTQLVWPNILSYFASKSILHWYVVILLSSKIKMQGGLKINTVHSYMPVRSNLKIDCILNYY